MRRDGVQPAARAMPEMSGTGVVVDDQGEGVPRSDGSERSDSQRPATSGFFQTAWTRRFAKRDDDTSSDDFTDVLRLHLGLTGEITPLEPRYPGCLRLGELNHRGRSFDLFLRNEGWGTALSALLADQMLATWPSIVVIPTLRGVPFSAIHRHAPGAHVALITFDDAIAADYGESDAERTLDSLTAGVPTPLGTGWWIITHDGRRSISREEYADLVAHGDEFDLFLDGAGTAFSQSFAAATRCARHESSRIRLSIHQRHALTELIARAAPLRPRDIRCLRDTPIREPARVVDSARHVVDVRFSRYRWQSFHTIRGNNRDDKRYLFRPPDTLRYACVVFGSECASGSTGKRGRRVISATSVTASGTALSRPATSWDLGGPLIWATPGTCQN